MMATFNEVLTGMERVLDTPLPTAYSIAIAQISWIYILVLPFQLYNALVWITIPASIGKHRLHSIKHRSILTKSKWLPISSLA